MTRAEFEGFMEVAVQCAMGKWHAKKPSHASAPPRRQMPPGRDLSDLAEGQGKCGDENYEEERGDPLLGPARGGGGSENMTI